MRLEPYRDLEFAQKSHSNQIRRIYRTLHFQLLSQKPNNRDILEKIQRSRISAIEVHLEFERVRTHANRVYFFLSLVVYPPVDERFGEDIAL